MNQKRRELRRYILPTVAGRCSTFLYIVVDGIFVGRGVGVDALGAVNIASPFTLLMIALCTLMTVGGVTITAIRLGRGDKSGANEAFRHATLLAFAGAALLMAAGMLFSREISVFLGANSTFLDMSSEYIFYCSAFSMPWALGIMLQGFVRNDGSPGLVGVAVITAAVLNIFLDWLFIFPLQMGIKGAAIATGSGEVFGFLILITHFIRRKGALRFGRIGFSGALIGKIMKRGLPEMVSQLGMPVMTLCINYILIRNLGDISVSAFGVLSYLLSFSMGIFFGVSKGLQPLIGQSYGRKDAEELSYYFRSGMAINLFAGLAVYASLLVFGKSVYALFSSDPTLIRTVAGALPKFGWGFLPMALNLTTVTYLYSTKRTARAATLATARCLALNPASILLLPRMLGAEIVWYAAGLAELLSFFLAVMLLKHSEKGGVVFR
jgi:putative MATE family efflux protein